MQRYTVGLVRNRVNWLYIERSTTRIARVVSGFDSHLWYHIETHCLRGLSHDTTTQIGQCISIWLLFSETYCVYRSGGHEPHKIKKWVKARTQAHQYVSLSGYCLVKHFAQARNTSVESLSARGCEKSELSLPQLLGMRIRKRQREETECFTKWYYCLLAQW